jgi:Ca2+-binding EF-hand superfamily protein
MQDKQIKLMIENLDEDDDGEVSLVEFLSLLEPLVQRAERQETQSKVADRMFKMLDADGGGSVSTQEFKEMLIKIGMNMSYDEVRGLFAEYDESQDGSIDVEEFEAMMAHQL